MATKTVVSNIELSAMPANSIKANPTNSSSQPYDMVVNSNQIIANFSSGLGSFTVADNQVVCNPSGAGVGLTALNIGENQVFCNPSGAVGLTGLNIPVNTVLGNAANGLNAITLQGINGIETTTSGNTIRIDGNYISNLITRLSTPAPSAPCWFAGQTNKLLTDETGSNRISQQISRSNDFTAYLQSVVAANAAVPSMPYAISVSEPGGQGTASGEGTIVLGDGNVFTYGGYIFSSKSGGGYLASGLAGQSGGGCLMADGRIFITPSNYLYDGKYGTVQGAILDLVAGTSTLCGGTLAHWQKSFYNSALLPDGRIYCNTNISGIKATIYDPVTNTTTESNNAPTGNSHTCVGLRDGRVYRIPGNGTTGSYPAWIYDPTTNNFVAAGGTIPTTNNGWFGGRLTAEGKVVAAPNNTSSTGALIYDPVTNNHTTTGVLGWYNSNPGNVLNYSGGTLLPNGNLFFPPWCAIYGIIYNPYNNTTIQVKLISNSSTGGYGGSSLLPNGDVYVCGYSYPDKILSYQHVKDFDMNTITSPYFNHGSY